jgi:pectinesterase
VASVPPGEVLSICLVAFMAVPLSFAHAPVASQKTRIVLVGDSTVTDDSGWGAGLKRLVAEPVEVVNVAANGRSSKSFIDEGRWTEALAQKGQYYLIQFGHNDEPGKGPERETDPKTTYRANMVRYVDDVRAIGAKPILVTSLVRRLYNADGTIRTTQTPYVEVVRALAAEKQVPLVDLHAISLSDAEQAGDDVWADLSPRDEKGQVDRTHLNAKGSEVVGRMVVDALLLAAPELAPLFRAGQFPDLEMTANLFATCASKPNTSRFDAWTTRLALLRSPHTSSTSCSR